MRGRRELEISNSAFIAFHRKDLNPLDIAKKLHLPMHPFCFKEFLRYKVVEKLLVKQARKS